MTDPTILVIIGAALLPCYGTFLTLLFKSYREIRLDWGVVVDSLINEEIELTKQFIEDEVSMGIDCKQQNTPIDEFKKNGRIKQFIKDRRSNAYCWHEVRTLISKLGRYESNGQIWCWVGLIAALLSLVIIITKFVSTISIYIVLFLWFLPLLVVACIYSSNMKIRQRIETRKTEIERKWEF